MKKKTLKRGISILLAMLLTASSTLIASANDDEEGRKFAEDMGISYPIEFSIPKDHYAVQNSSARAVAVNNGTYYIRNKRTGKYLTAIVNTDNDGSVLYGSTLMLDYTGEANQLWQLEAVAPNDNEPEIYFTLRPLSEGLDSYLSVNGVEGSSAENNTFIRNGTNMIVSHNGRVPASHFAAIAADDGSYMMVTRTSRESEYNSNEMIYNKYITCDQGLDSVVQRDPYIYINGSSHWFFEETAYQSSSYEGWLDLVNNTTIAGWAYDPYNPNREINVRITVEDQNGAIYYDRRISACIYDAGLEAAGKGNGYHLFSHSIDWSKLPAGTYTVKAYAHGNLSSKLSVSNNIDKTYTSTENALAGEYEKYGLYGWKYPLRSGDSNDIRVSAWGGCNISKSFGIRCRWSSCRRVCV